MLRSRDAEIKKVLSGGDVDAQEKEKLKDLINDEIDFRAMGAAALGSHWEPLTAEQRDHFVSVFGGIVRSQSVGDLEVYKSPVSYGKITVNADTATVNTTITYKEEPATVVYKLLYHDKKWWVADIILNDVSTVAGYARSFQSVVRKKGFDVLMSKLEEKLASTEAVG
ncbi:MAG: ABC transporter substrate-binding protein [Bacteroidetes bacterium]|nr:ABC transporter substrate-binding protein [Bacteroidota bacterium]